MATDALREALAALEHQQWQSWAAALLRAEALSRPRVARWERLTTTAYADLTEDEKEQDRVWADRVLVLLEQHKEEKS